MAHGWDPYTQNVSLSSERETPEPELSNPQHADELIGHGGCSCAIISNEPSATNTNYYNHSIEATNSNQNHSGWSSEVGDCQRQDQPMVWQSQGEQKYLPRMENIESNFRTDILASPEHCSFAPQLEGHTQDCSVPTATPFYENYPNVNSSTDAELGEPRSSCKFMTCNSVLKPKADTATTSPRSKEWLQNHHENILPSDYPNTNLAKLAKGKITLCAKGESKSFKLDGFSSTDMISHTQSKKIIGDGQSWKQENFENTSPDKDNSCHSGYISHSQLEETSSGSEDQNMIDAKGAIEMYTEKNTDSRETGVTASQGTNTQMDCPKTERPTSVSVSKKGSCQAGNDLSVSGSLLQSKTVSQSNPTNDLMNSEISDATETNDDSKSNLLIHGAEIPCAKRTAETLCRSPTATGKFETCIHPDVNPNFDPFTESVPCTNVVSDLSGGICPEFSENKAQSDLSTQNGIEIELACSEGKTSTLESIGCSDPTSDKGQSVQSLDSINKQSGIFDSESSSMVECNTNPDKETSITSCTNLAITCDDQSVNKSTKDEQDHNSDNMAKQLRREKAPPRQCEEESPGETSSTDQMISKTPEKDILDQDLLYQAQAETPPSDELDAIDTTSSLEQPLHHSAKTTSCLDFEQTSDQSSETLENNSLGHPRQESLVKIGEEKKSTFHVQKSAHGDVGRPLRQNSSKVNEMQEPDTCQFVKPFIEKKPQLKPSTEMSKQLQPIVLVKTLDVVDLTRDLYTCPECMHTTSNLDLLIDHHHCHHLKHSFQLCRSCGIYLVPRGQSKKHLCGEIPCSPKSYTKKKRKLYCIKCQRSFPKTNVFVSHMRTHTGKTPYVCEKCGLYFSQGSALRRHKSIPARCRNAVRRAFSVKTPAAKSQKGSVKLMRHCYVKVFDIAKTPFCKLCGKCFKTELKAKKHIYNVHRKKGIKSKQSKPITDISVEVNTEKNYKCPLCPQIFQYSPNRNRHLKDCVREIAWGKKNLVRGRYQCPLCLATFSLPSNRYRHIHTFCLRNFLRFLGRSNQSKPIEITQPTNNMKTVLNKLKEEEGQLQCHSTDKAANYERHPQYSCHLCPAVFFHPSGKYRHMKKHELFEHTGRVFKYKYSLKKLKQMKSKLTANREEEQELQVSLKCKFCEKSFGSSRTLKMHEPTHKGERPYRCLECGKGFKRHPNLIQHKVTHQRRIQCTVCRKILPTIGELIKHRKTHPNKGLLQCPDCPKQLKHPAFLLRHLRSHQKRQNKLYKSDKTQETLDSAKTPSELQCPLCKEAFDDPQSLRKHSLTHIANSSSPQCPFCKRKFTDRRYLLRHITRHIGGKIIFCKCGKRFFIESNFKLHRKTCPENKTQKETNQSNVCRICSRTFYRQIHLSKHYWGHKNKTLILCKTCHMYYGASNIYEHYRICQKKPLSGSGPTSRNKTTKQSMADKYKCQYCSQMFRYPCYYLRHLATHRDVESHACIHCGRNFPNKTLCFHHEASCDGFNTIESGNKEEANKEDASEFKCKFCNKVFTKSQKLRRHILTHNEVKPYRCKACESCFSRYDHLKGHLGSCKGKPKMQLRPEICIPKISLDQVGTGWQKEFGAEYVEEEKPLKCEECGKEFVTKSKLTWHNSMFHTIKKQTSSQTTDISCEKQNSKILARLQSTSSKQNLNKTYKCSFCPRTFRTNVHLKAHKRLHTDEKSFVCDCGKTFSRKENLQHHRTICVRKLQSPSHGFSCAYCSSRFMLFSELQEHFLNAHDLGKNDKPLKTAPLQQHLSDIQNFKENPLDVNEPSQPSEPSEPKESPFTCKICKKGYWNKTLLRNHFRKCRRMVTNNDTLQVEVPLRADIDLALTDSSAEDSPEEYLENTEPQEPQEPQSKPSEEKKPPVYQCSECDQSFTDGLLLISHLEDHGREEQERRLNKCSKCGKTFPNQARLKIHMRIHESGEFVCPGCSIVLSSMSELETHRKTYHNPSYSFSCRLCNYKFKTKVFLCDHYIKEHPNDVFSCDFCNKSYTLRTSLIRHHKNCPNQNRIEQQKESAEKSSTSLSTSESESEENENYVNQIDNGDSEDSDSDTAPYFPCHVCGKTFQTSESLEDHQRCHLGEKPHECEQCGQCFFQAAQLQQHQRKHKSEFQCRICGRGFVSLFALRKHKHTTGKKRPFQCSKCHLCFTSLSQLAEHKLTHREENFPCDICNRVFVSKSSRAEHRKIHLPKPSISSQAAVVTEHKKPAPLKTMTPTNEFKYRCGACCVRFRNPEELSEHGCMASVERQYSCLDCDKHFLHSSHLQKHLSTHKQTSQSSYPCNQCNNNFSSSLDFLNHLKNHDNTSTNSTVRGGPGFICPVCRQCFPSATELVYHFPMHPHGKFQCKTCNMSCHTESKLKEHEKCHLKEIKWTKKKSSFLGDDTFSKHDCSPKHIELMNTKYSNVSKKDVSIGDEDDIDVTGEDLCYCPFCPMRFSSKSHLLEHQNIKHRKEKPFICEICGKSFPEQKHLNKHLKRHSKREPAQSTSQIKFQCAQCHSEFNSAKDLSIHLKLHAAEKEVGEYRCDMCYKSFSQLRLLRQHQESHVGQVVYECTECDKAFAFPHLLEEHQKSHA